MNQKKAKAIRKALRATGIDPQDSKPMPKPGLNLLSGFSGQHAFTQNSGRATYQRAKSLNITRAAA